VVCSGKPDNPCTFVSSPLSAEMAKQGLLNEHGRPFNHKSVASMLAA